MPTISKEELEDVLIDDPVAPDGSEAGISTNYKDFKLIDDREPPA